MKEKHYYVYGESFGIVGAKFKTIDEAKEAAIKSARQKQGTTFYVLETVLSVKGELPVVVEGYEECTQQPSST